MRDGDDPGRQGRGGRRSRRSWPTRVAALAAAGRRPGLGTVLVGDDPGSRAYVAGKHRDCAKVGIASIRRDLPADASQADVEAVVDELNADPACTGYIVQLPLPRGLDANAVAGADGPGQGRRRAAPDQPRAARARRARRRCRARRAASWSCCGATTSRSPAPRSSWSAAASPSGRPLGLLLTRRSENATVTLCHTGTRDLAAHTCAAPTSSSPPPGVAGLVTADMVRPGAAVLDVGVTRTEPGLVGRRRTRRSARSPGFLAPDARRRRADDAGDAADQRRRGRRAGRRARRLTAAMPVTTPRRHGSGRPGMAGGALVLSGWRWGSSSSPSGSFRRGCIVLGGARGPRVLRCGPCLPTPAAGLLAVRSPQPSTSWSSQSWGRR